MGKKTAFGWSQFSSHVVLQFVLLTFLVQVMVPAKVFADIPEEIKPAILTEDPEAKPFEIISTERGDSTGGVKLSKNVVSGSGAYIKLIIHQDQACDVHASGPEKGIVCGDFIEAYRYPGNGKSGDWLFNLSFNVFMKNYSILKKRHDEIQNKFLSFWGTSAISKYIQLGITPFVVFALAYGISEIKGKSIFTAVPKAVANLLVKFAYTKGDELTEDELKVLAEEAKNSWKVKLSAKNILKRKPGSLNGFGALLTATTIMGYVGYNMIKNNEEINGETVEQSRDPLDYLRNKYLNLVDDLIYNEEYQKRIFLQNTLVDAYNAAVGVHCEVSRNIDVARATDILKQLQETMSDPNQEDLPQDLKDKLSTTPSADNCKKDGVDMIEEVDGVRRLVKARLVEDLGFAKEAFVLLSDASKLKLKIADLGK